MHRDRSSSSKSASAGLLIVGLGMLGAPFDTAVNIAFPSIAAAFGVDIGAMQWIVIPYMLTYASLMLVFGRVGDLFGHRRVFQCGLAISAAAFAACSLAPSFAALAAFRAVQGIGIGVTLSCAPALITALYPETRRSWALAAFTAMFAAGAALGPLLGGALVQLFGWNAVFWIRAPLAVVALALSWRLPSTPPDERARRFDFLGAALLAAGLAALSLGLASGTQPGTTRTAILVALAIFIFIGFVRHSRRIGDPVIHPSLITGLDINLMHAANIAINLAAFAVLLLVPFYLSRALNLQAALAGAILACAPLGTIAGALAAGRFGHRVGPRLMNFIGIMLCGAGLAALGQGSVWLGLGGLIAALLAQGFGFGLFQTGYTDHVMGILAGADRGVAGSLTLVTRTLGVIGGATVLSVIFQHVQGNAMAVGLSEGAAFLAGYSATLTGAGVGLVAGLCLSLLRFKLWF